jgi:hypothetical protein
MITKSEDNKTQTRDYWKAEEETIIQQWADKAQCYQWMHARCREIYQTKNAWFTIPVIIISTITGTANFAQDRFGDNIKDYVVMSIGTMSIIAGIITTIYQFLKISEYNEGHRVASISWGKFYNNLKTTGLRHPLDRMNPNYAIKMYQDEYDRLKEVSPDILPKILKSFNKKFKKNKELVKPEIGNKLDYTKVYEMNDEERQKMIDDINNVKPNKKFVNTFFNLTGRNPSDEEIESVNDSTHLNIEIENNSNNSNNSSISDDSEDSNESNNSVINNVDV